MAAASWMIPNRTLRLGKTHTRLKVPHAEDTYKLDFLKTPDESALEILSGLCIRNVAQNETSASLKHQNSLDSKTSLSTKLTQKSASDSRRLSYLNALVKLLSKEETRSNIGFTTEELMVCLRISLVDEATHVRAAALRVLRYLLRTKEDVDIFNALRLPYLVTRCMDVVLRNEVERAQALRVVRRAVSAGGSRAASAADTLMRCLAAVAGAGAGGMSGDAPSSDRLSRACVATLAEIGVLYPMAFISYGGVGVVMRYLQECATPRMSEALCGVLLHTLDSPATRRLARIDLRCLAAPYCDFHFKDGLLDKNTDEREMRITRSRLALVSVLRSWPGLLHFCHPLNDAGLRALVHVLYVNQLEIRKAVLDLLYELLGLPHPEWTDEVWVALGVVDPSDFQDSWRLNEGFVAAEGRTILPHLEATGPDITEIYLALLLYCFLEAGLLDSLAEVIVSKDTYISIRATVLMGQFLHLLHLLLPPEIASVTPALPCLLKHAAAGNTHALAAIATLQSFHSLLEARPATSSLFLDHIVQCCNGEYEEKTLSEASPSKLERSLTLSPVEVDAEFLEDDDYEEYGHRYSLGSRSDSGSKSEGLVKSKSVSSRTSAVVSKVAKSAKIFNLFDREGDTMLKDTNVLQSKDASLWNWCIIRAILKDRSASGGDGSPLPMNDASARAWLRTLLFYLHPSSNRFSHAGSTHPKDATLAGCQLVRHLLAHPDPEAHRMLEELFNDVNAQVTAITTARSAHECLFSPQHMNNTMCQMYFLFVGQLCHTRAGLKLFNETGLYQSLLQLSTTTPHPCYVKLVISSLDYTIDSYPREILAQTLTCSTESSRLYATQFLNVLLRATQKSGEMLRRRHTVPSSVAAKRVHRDSNRSPYNGDIDGQKQSGSGPDIDIWVLELLVKQIRDESKAVMRCALTILDEACSIPLYLNTLVRLRNAIRVACIPPVTAPASSPSALGPNEEGAGGDLAYLLWMRLEVAAAALTDQPDIDTLTSQTKYWRNLYNYRYVRLVDADLHDALTLHRRSSTEAGGAGGARGVGGRGRRGGGGGGGGVGRRGARPPPHLYAQLAAHARGLNVLARHGDLEGIVQCIKEGKCGTEQEIMDLKASLWAASSASLSTAGMRLLLSCSAEGDEGTPADTVRLATHCPVYSVRATAFYALGLIGSTYTGANLLYSLGWPCVRHTRHDRFPIIQEEKWFTKTASDEELYRQLLGTGSPSEKPYQNNGPVATDTGDVSENSDRTDHSAAESGTKNAKSVTEKNALAEESCDSFEAIEEGMMNVSLEGRAIRTISENSDRPEKRMKSQTLPQRLYPGSKKHQRSLSESKTVDKFRSDEEATDTGVSPAYERFHIGPISENKPMIGRMNSFDQWQEGRVRNISESSTSGVSSCDSVYGKYVLYDRFMTLSPIPSSSSLSAMKGAATRRNTGDSQRRISLQSYTGSEAASSPPSQRDLVGYATLKTLTRHRRPVSEDVCSQEVVGLLSDGGDGDGKVRGVTGGSHRDRTRAIAQRSAKLSLFKYDWKPMGTHNSTTSELLKVDDALSSLPPTGNCLRPSGNLSFKRGPPPSDGPCYIGICMPHNLLDLFPPDEDQLGRQKLDEEQEESYATGVDGSLSMEISVADVVDGGKKEDQNFGLVVKGGAGGGTHWWWSEGVEGGESSGGGSESGARRRHEVARCLLCARAARHASTAQLREAFFAVDPCGSPTSLDSSLSKTSDSNSVACQVLNNAERMGNPIWYKQSKQALLQLKQKHPEVFQSPCLYSEICVLMAQGTYRVVARRFLQELFLDLSFDCFYAESELIIQSKMLTIKSTLTKV